MSAGFDKPLAGIKVLITRAEGQADPLIKSVERLGGIPVSIPMISFKKTGKSLPDGKYDWIIFTSANAFKFACLTKERLAALGHPKIAAIGEKTKEAIERLGFRIDFIPESFIAEAFVREFTGRLKQQEKVLLPKGNLARNIIYETLTSEGHICTEIIMYENKMPPSSESGLIEFFETNKADVLTFTSASTAANFMKIVRKNNLEEAIQESVVACIGPAAKNKAEALGLTVQICPDTYTVDGMLQAIIAFYKNDMSRRKL
ncbi:uroporphyrinogen-III synthase [Peribacillus deserti]|uniref:Uroporphyrinogen-III synthase n=1 Tax=Peribacillus deserti TaxID=673318 RepID=A0A2N5M749_9BACI|nr:uroporphyrinogen-III synthase [Peribacillus deserti]PLT30180.1 uroporphyrinogen-III synthase [Peribacillus deserti]